MALSKPVLDRQNAFDSNQAHQFSFNVTGGQQVVENQLTIRNNATNVIVYQQTQTSFKFEHIVAPNSLTNGTYYSATLVTYDAQHNVSPVSNAIQFYCYSQPKIEFINIPVSGVIENSSYSFEIQYNQLQGELLNSYIINLYNSSRIKIATSNNQYVGSSVPPPTNLSYLFSGFDDNSFYYIEGLGQTVNGTEITTGLIQFTVKYVKPNIFTIMELTNNCNGGYITAKSNIVLIDGESNPSPPIYIQNKEVDIRGNNYYVQWRKGYVINGNFTVKIKTRNVNENATICTFNNPSNDIIKVKYMVDNNDSTKVYIEVWVNDLYYIYSSSIVKPTAQEQICVQIRRVRNIYEVKFENTGVIV
ncbi:MAG: hypothetical protein RSD67_05330 [Oscillospiraceae bacterium]